MLPSTFVRFLLSSLCLISFAFAQRYPYPYPEYPYVKPQYPVQQILSPIALNTSDARAVSVPPCKIYISRNAQLRLVNTGDGVVAIPLRAGDIILRGGPVFDDEYICNVITYRNDGVPYQTRAAATENGRGTAVAHAISLYKKSYGSPQNALRYSDGYVIIIIQVIIAQNGQANPYFKPYERALYSVRQPNATTFVNAERAIYWLLEALRRSRYYYAWPGTQFGVPAINGGLAGKQYPAAAVTIQIPLRYSPVISLSQFYVYPSIFNQYGESTTNVLGIHPENGRPIVKCENGFRLYNLPGRVY